MRISVSTSIFAISFIFSGARLPSLLPGLFLAKRLGLSSVSFLPLVRKSLSARSCSVPPHLRPSATSADLSLSRPRVDSSCTVMLSSVGIHGDTDTQ